MTKLMNVKNKLIKVKMAPLLRVSLVESLRHQKNPKKEIVTLGMEQKMVEIFADNGACLVHLQILPPGG